MAGGRGEAYRTREVPEYIPQEDYFRSSAAEKGKKVVVRDKRFPHFLKSGAEKK